MTQPEKARTMTTAPANIEEKAEVLLAHQPRKQQTLTFCFEARACTQNPGPGVINEVPYGLATYQCKEPLAHSFPLHHGTNRLSVASLGMSLTVISDV